MARRPALYYLLLFALLAGQWLYVTHSDDDAAHDSEHHCQLCLHGIQYDTFLFATLLKSPLLTPHPFLIFPSLTNRSMSQSRFHDSRAPPRG